MFRLLKRAPGRFAKSFGYTWDGLKATFRKEESLRLATVAFFAMGAMMLACQWPAWKKLALVTLFLLIPLAEIFNSAIEDICDLVTKEHSLLVKSAKEKGALAVLLAIIMNALALIVLIIA